MVVRPSPFFSPFSIAVVGIKKKKKKIDVLKPFLCPIGVSVVDPFSHVVLILQQNPPTFPPYSFQLSRFAFDKEAVMVVRPSPFFSPLSIASLA